MGRLMGVLTLRGPVYKQIAEDPSVTTTAGIIVVLATLVSGFTNGLLIIDAATGAVSTNISSAIAGAVVAVVFGLIAWFVGAWITAMIAKLFGGKTDTGEMLRVSGFAKIFSFVSLFSLLALVSTSLMCIVAPMALVVSVLAILGNLIGIREAAEFGIGKAIGTAIVAGVIRAGIEITAAGAVTAMVMPMLSGAR